MHTGRVWFGNNNLAQSISFVTAYSAVPLIVAIVAASMLVIERVRDGITNTASRQYTCTVRLAYVHVDLVIYQVHLPDELHVHA